MKKLLLILFCPILLLTSCSKSGVTPQSLEGVIVGKKWILNNDVNGFYLSQNGGFYSTEVCGEDVQQGNWIIEDDLIKYRYYLNSQEVTILYGQVSEYTSTQIKLVDSSDPNMTVNTVYNAFTEIYGCTDATADNYNEDANCDDGGCNYCISNECTYVPDDNFEQQLIDLGYDDILDNYVLTENINQITNLELLLGAPVDPDLEGTHNRIQNITGLEDFISLSDLHLTGWLSIDLSSLPSLISITTDEFYGAGPIKAHNGTLLSISGPGSFDIAGATALTHFHSYYLNVSELDFSNNIALETLILSDGNGDGNLNLSNNVNLTQLHLNNLSGLECVQVHNVSWANSISDLQLDSEIYFSEDCP